MTYSIVRHIRERLPAGLFLAAGVALVTACAGPRGPVVDPETMLPPDAPPPAEYAQDDTYVTPPPTAAAAPRSEKPRLFGFLFKRVPGEVTAEETEVAAAPVPAERPEVTTGAMATSEAPSSGRGGFLGLFGGNDAPAADGPVADLPFGKIATVCGLSRREMGEEVARSGNGQFRLYDSAPDSVAPRAQFLTGFRDGCARKFTASLALFGTAQVHEATRYNPLNTNPYSETDEAYETVKTRVCRVERGAFCPERRAGRLDRQAAFLSVYRDFGGSGSWMELFLHDRELVAQSTLGG
ncbi:hypothetical protein P1J78_20575 [Psychromarinibacter sp. C21-152]|uniref:Uncharacterized protein n=1 Tax=Psychromarinibacter sediminicola TaxID=3033385 RepID=A0AAE3NTA6_9RHOB|nr:hypothetical protein [Psychromarinibacter sediminicola]MDF0603148.1 hypothetical protein [Psychromarinibacter sediminicola]